MTRHSISLTRQKGVAADREITAAVKAAVMVEDAARTLWAAMLIGDPQALPPEAVRRLHRAYTTSYGQR